jgi:flagellar biosynthesis/type III secretory pathway M-ring protein FliF/YscJ
MLFLSNFLRRAGDFLLEYRDRIIKWALIAVSALLVILLLYGFIENIVRSRSYKRINELEQQYQEAEARAKDFKAQADVLKAALDLNYAEQRKLKEQAAAADAALNRTRREVAPLKETYEKARNTPVDTAADAADLDCADLCARLAELGHPCQ